jgi:hypothetical protein
LLEIDAWIPSEISAISPLVERLMWLIEGSHCVTGEEHALQLALREALNNAVVHGNRLDVRKLVHVRCRCRVGKGISLIVSDQGQGFQLKAFTQAGGQVLFGTDVGYIEKVDTSEEFAWMPRADMRFQKILASLTTNPAQRFGYSSHSGRIAKGMDADLVVLSADPAQSTTGFSQVRYTIRNGKVIYSKK